MLLFFVLASAEDSITSGKCGKDAMTMTKEACQVLAKKENKTYDSLADNWVADNNHESTNLAIIVPFGCYWKKKQEVPANAANIFFNSVGKKTQECTEERQCVCKDGALKTTGTCGDDKFLTAEKCEEFAKEKDGATWNSKFSVNTAMKEKPYGCSLKDDVFTFNAWKDSPVDCSGRECFCPDPDLPVTTTTEKPKDDDDADNNESTDTTPKPDSTSTDAADFDEGATDAPVVDTESKDDDEDDNLLLYMGLIAAGIVLLVCCLFFAFYLQKQKKGSQEVLKAQDEELGSTMKLAETSFATSRLPGGMSRLNTTSQYTRKRTTRR